MLLGAPKSGKARRVEIMPQLVERLARRRSVREAEAAVVGRALDPAAWVFPAPTDDSKPMNGAFLRFKVWYPVFTKAKLRAVRIHDLRHSYASMLLGGNVPMIYVKEQLGHSSINVTVDLYGHIRPRGAPREPGPAGGAHGPPRRRRSAGRARTMHRHPKGPEAIQSWTTLGLHRTAAGLAPSMPIPK